MGKMPIECKGGRTKQSFKDECDINVLMRKYQKSGKLPENVRNNPIFMDLGTPFDYQESLNQVVKAREAFDMLPGEVRKRFSHDPYKLVEFVGNPDNIDEVVKLGLAKKKEIVESPPEGETKPDANK